MITCNKPPTGWICSREVGHDGPCAASPIEQRVVDKQDMVQEFMIACDQVVGDKPGLRDQLLRIRLITEEANETASALYAGDLVQVIDGLCDILYVTYGTAVAIGVDIKPFFDEVHRSNMDKVNPVTGKVIKDLFGKVIKPVGWTPPDVSGLFEKMYGSVENFPAESQSHDDQWHVVLRLAVEAGMRPCDLATAISYWQDN